MNGPRIFLTKLNRVCPAILLVGAGLTVAILPVFEANARVSKSSAPAVITAAQVANAPSNPAAQSTKTPSANYEDYIGMTYTGGSIDQLPGSLTDSGGWIVRSPAIAPETDYAISDITDEETNTRLIFFNKEIDRSVTPESNQAVWEIVDVLLVPALDDPGNPDGVAHLRPWCSYDESSDPELFALANTEDYETAEFFPAIAAWRANTQTETLEPVTTEGLLCVNVGLGV